VELHSGPGGPGDLGMRKAAGAVAAAFALGTGAMTVMGVALASQVEAAVLVGVGLALYASSSLLTGNKTVSEPTTTAGSVAKQA